MKFELRDYLLPPVLATALIASTVSVACEVDVSDYVGWQIFYSGTVTGYLNDDGYEVDGFDGCEHGRVLIVDYSYAVTCAEYNYAYAYLPEIVMMSNGSQIEACIDGDMYLIRIP